MWKVYWLSIEILPVWHVGARERGVSKNNSLFHFINSGYMLLLKDVWAFKTFRFAVGLLDSPTIANAGRLGWIITLRQDNGNRGFESESLWPGVRRLLLWHVVPSLLINNSIARRNDGEIAIEIPKAGQPEWTQLHLYLFFKNEERDLFSPSEYVELQNRN